MDVSLRRDQDVEVARTHGSLLEKLEPIAPPGVDLLDLGAAVQADEAPGQLMGERRLGPRRHDEREQAEGTVTCPVEKPLADAPAHSALGRGLLELGGQ